MRRRSRTAGGSEKPRRHKSATPKRRNAPQVTRNRGASTTGQETVVARLTHERDEALLREAANSEILRLISRSPDDLELVFRTILENATRICNANFGTLFRFDGENLYPAAQFNTSAALLEAQLRRGPFKPTPGTAMEHVVRTKQVSHSADKAAEPVPGFFAEHGGARTQVIVPMLKDDALIGAITIYRQEVRPFTEKQIELVKNFAAQAVIAIENTRLLNELRQRTTDLSESLEQQTATAGVLSVISSSPGELKPVFQTILENATRICEAKFGTLYLCEGEGFRTVAAHNAPPAYIEARTRELIQPAPDTALGGVAATKRVVHIADIKTIPSYVKRNPFEVITVELGGYRTVLAVPMLKNNELIGVITINRQEVRPFSDKQIALVQNFANQAVIAIENARLLSELRQRTTDLGEALEQQTATADVLRVISSSPGNLEPVFQAMLEKAVSICNAKFGTLFRFDGSAFHFAARVNTPAALAEFQKKRGPFLPPLGSNLDRMMKTKQVQHSADDAAEPVPAQGLRLGGARSIVHVPMLQSERVVGALAIYRQEVRPFTEKQIELLKNFAAQAVIAIENARLVNELKQSLEQQTATADVLRVISSSPGELEPVFNTMLGNATRLCDATFGILYLSEGDGYRAVAMHNVPLALVEARQNKLLQFAADAAVTRAATTKQPCHHVDARTEQSYLAGDPQFVAAVNLGGMRTVVSVPILKDDQLIGVISIYRQEVRPFTDKQIALVENFAAQAVIAIENARLLNDLNKLNQQLEQRVSDQVGEIERMSRLRRFLPPQVADLIVASGTEKQLESHRREITALFCDLRGFTGFSESSDPEDVMALLRDYHAAIGQIIVKYSGTLERFAGDGVMVIFNDPVPVENPALQAVLMALDMRTAIGGMIEKWRDLGHDLGFGIGIAHGFATLGTIGFEGRFDYAAIGTVSNIASRLCDEAKPGEILISPRVRQAVERAVTVEPVGEFTLKGIRRPMVACNVLASAPSKPN
jgi:GAF domain-containing protein